MPPRIDVRSFRNEELVLRVSQSVDPAKWDENRYEGFFDALCRTREYQKVAIKTALRFILGGRYADLRALAEENFQTSDALKDRYGTLEAMERRLLLPDRLYCTIDLATGTGKSYVLYGLAMVALAEGVADQVLVLCPSNTIESGLIAKFEELAVDQELRDSLPADAIFRVPQVIRADETIEKGCICVENFHSIFEHVKNSTIRENLAGKGERTLVLNDEIHHVTGGKRDVAGKWERFLHDPQFGFRRIVGVSGTCYAGNDYFADVVTRYSLNQAMEDRVIKNIKYVTEEDIGHDFSERSQIVFDNHNRNRTTYRKVKPLTIVVTKDISACEDFYEEWVDFLSEHEKIDRAEAAKKVLVVTSSPRHAPNLLKLPTVDRKDTPFEWIVSVSMLTEGWDVKNVFQIVPHEERAFNSKLLISQVLGRGLRIPDEYPREQPTVVVFNHDSWSGRIKHLVQEVLEVEKKISSFCEPGSPYNFDVHQIDYTRVTDSKTFTQTDQTDLLKKGYVDLPTQLSVVEREVEYEQAGTTNRTRVKTTVRKKTYSVDEVGIHVFERLRSIDSESSGLPAKKRTSYAKKYPLAWCKGMVRESVRRAGEKEDVVSEESRQKILQALGPLERGESKSVRYQSKADALRTINTDDRRVDYVTLNSLRLGDMTLIYGSESRASLKGEELSNFDEAVDEDSELPRKAVHEVRNAFHFRTPLNVVIADHDPERRFVKKITDPENAIVIDAWVKGPDRDFYPIEFSWKKGEHTKRANFNPDFFIKVGSKIYVVEIKDDSQISDPSDENRKKFEFARTHFDLLNQMQAEQTYQLNFLSPQDYDAFFQKLRAGELGDYQSHLDVALRT